MAQNPIKESIISKLSHEIKNPLNAISISSQLLKKELRNPAKLNSQDYMLELVSKIDKQVETILSILENFKRFQLSGDIELSFQSINQLISETIDSLKPLIISKNARVHTDYDLKIPRTRLNPVFIKEALYNILLNSIEVSDQIQIRTRLENDLIIISISDSGPGIGSELKDRIFEPYFSTKKGGSGLGLTIAQSIICAHEGELELNSDREQGVEFLVKLPVNFK